MVCGWTSWSPSCSTRGSGCLTGPPEQAIRPTDRGLAVNLSAVGNREERAAIERLVLAALGPEDSSTGSIASRTGEPAGTIDAAVSRLVRDGLVETVGARVRLTRQGRLVAASVRRSWPPTTAAEDAVPTVDVGEITRSLGSAWSAWSARSAARVAAEDAARDELLASDADRDATAQLLSGAFSQGRLSSAEFQARIDQALTARTRGELDDALEGLGDLLRPVRSHPVRKALFWVIALLSSPFVLLGGMLFFFGSDAGDHLGGLFFLVLLLPGLFALRRWARN